ncbi:MAG TPA: hypothetical protein VHD31_02690 [Candidatus Paceibacterota bacterium]|nr:hypothetical protein [Candidatus Paceibacterota bacterium]
MEEQKKQSGLSWSQPAASTQTQSKPASAPSGFTTTPASVRPTAAPAQPMKSSTGVTSSMPSAQHSTSRVVGGFIAGLIIGALITTIWFTSAGSSTSDTSDTATTTPSTSSSSQPSGSVATGNSMLPSGSLSVATQAAGMQVVVTSATVSVPTWLVVYESSNGQPVRILGASMFFPENNGKGITIPLLRATQAAQTYILGERVDDGDHMLSLTLDKPVTDASGSALWSSFKTN